MIVVDASVVVEWLLRSPQAAVLDTILEADTETLHAPQLIYVEVAEALHRLANSGELPGDRGVQALRDLTDLSIASYPPEPLLERIWELRGSITAYDATYVALAEGLDARLLTMDRRLVRSATEVARCAVSSEP